MGNLDEFDGLIMFKLTVVEGGLVIVVVMMMMMMMMMDDDVDVILVDRESENFHP